MSADPNNESLLSRLDIASPCDVDWDAMTGNDRVRACGDCKKNVYNISDMTKAEAESFLRLNGTSECTQFYQRADGTILTDDCPVGLRRIRNAWRKVRATAAVLVGCFFSLNAASAQLVPDRHVPKKGHGVFIFPVLTEMFEPKPKQKSFFEILTSGKYALKVPDEIFLARDQILIRQGPNENEVYRVPESYTPYYAKLRGDLNAKRNNYKNAEIFYKLAIKLQEVTPTEWATSRRIYESYARLLRKMNRGAEADALPKEGLRIDGIPAMKWSK